VTRVLTYLIGLAHISQGANKQVVCIDDISERGAVQHLPTGSDVFSVAQKEVGHNDIACPIIAFI